MRLLRTSYFGLLLLLCGCVVTQSDKGFDERDVSTSERIFSSAGDDRRPAGPIQIDRNQNQQNGQVGFERYGDPFDEMVAQPQNRTPLPKLTGAPVRANFVNSDLQAFARAVFEDILKVNYVIDPNVRGKITIRTAKAIPPNQLLRLVRDALARSGADLSFKNGTFVISQRAMSGSENALRMRTRYVAPSKLASALSGSLGRNVQLVADDATSTLSFKGTDRNTLQGAMQIAKTLDRDQMRHMSFALYPVKNAPAATLIKEIEQIYQGSGDASNTMIPIGRLNAILVITQRRGTLKRVRGWIRRLDKVDKAAVQSFIYPVQNRRASELAEILNKAFINKDGGTNGGGDTGSDAVPQQTAVIEGTFDEGASGEPRVRITADKTTNSLIVFATERQFRIIRGALLQLDIVPLQVMIEATIAEVRLNNDLRYGVRWFLQNGGFSTGFADNASGTVGNEYPGFNFAVNLANVQLVLSALEDTTDVEIISTPSLTVRDNQTAKLQVGDQVPIVTRTSTGTQTTNAPIISNVELKDTGIILAVTPRVNASGLVVLDIQQEASSVVPTTSSGIDSPTIRQRKIESSVAVESGSALILGGLLSGEKSRSAVGVPLAKDIPVIGRLFRRDVTRDRRSELIIILRPVVIRGEADMRAIANELERKMRNLSMIGVR